MKILITTSTFNRGSNPALDFLVSHGFEIIFNPFGRRLTEEEAIKLFDDDVVGVIAGVEPLTQSVFKSAKSLKVLSRAGTGMDNVDLSAAAAHGIYVCNTPNAPVAAVAELTIGLMLDLLRKISLADRNLRNGQWKPLMGNLLGEQIIGLIGCGRIGVATAQMLSGFGSEILICDPLYIGSEWRSVEMDELLSTANIVSLHVPYNKTTHHLINADCIMRMKRGALVINASRGEVVDEVALLDSLHSGHLAGAALDTFEQEPYTGPLVTMPQVVLTPHMGSYAEESRSRMEREATENLVRGLCEKGLLLSSF